LQEILKAFARHIYHVTKKYGRSQGQYRKEFLLEQGEDYDESYDTALTDDFWEKYQESAWFEQHHEKCRTFILNGDENADQEWKIFELYLLGKNTLEISWEINIPEPNVYQLLETAINKVREKIDLDDSSVYKISRTHRRRDISPRTEEKVTVEMDPNNVSLKDIMLKYNISKATASRMWRRAKENNGITWYIPNFRPKRTW